MRGVRRRRDRGKAHWSVRQRDVAALSIAGSFASGLSESLTDSSDVWRAHGGIAAHNGVLVALLARAGLTGPRGVLDSKKGFCTAFTDGRYDAGALVEGLGAESDAVMFLAGQHGRSRGLG